jgi:crotonobetainyl-CoA:carnitine CoA-transferase CaiB-like acyl-CoA transferase
MKSSTNSGQAKALDGIRVIDMTRYLPGSFATLMLADFGAEVIMVEKPGEGEPGRSNAPFINGVSCRHLLLQRNKKSITLDFRKPAGKEMLLKLVSSADVLIENFRPGYMASVGLDYEILGKLNQRLIYCSLSGFGQDGSYFDKAGHDINYISLAGVLGLSGSSPVPPDIPGVQMADMGGSMMGQIGILMALNARNHTGQGQYIDISFLDSAISMLSLAASAYFAEGKSYGQGEHVYTGSRAWYNVYAAKDGKYLTIGALEAKYWQRLCNYLEVPEFIDIQFDLTCQETMRKKLQQIFLGKNRDEWLQILLPLDVCASPVSEISEVFSNENTKDREMVFSVEHPVAGSIKQIGFPIKMSATPAVYKMGAPALGEHNVEICTWLGYSLEDIEVLKKHNII